MAIDCRGGAEIFSAEHGKSKREEPQINPKEPQNVKDCQREPTLPRRLKHTFPRAKRKALIRRFPRAKKIKSLIRRTAILKQEVCSALHLCDRNGGQVARICKTTHPNKGYLYLSNSNGLFNLPLASFQTTGTSSTKAGSSLSLPLFFWSLRKPLKLLAVLCFLTY